MQTFEQCKAKACSPYGEKLINLSTLCPPGYTKTDEMASIKGVGEKVSVVAKLKQMLYYVNPRNLE